MFKLFLSFFFLSFSFIISFDLKNNEDDFYYPQEYSIISIENIPRNFLNNTNLCLFQNNLLIGQYLSRSASFYTFINNSTWLFTTLLKPSISDISDRFGVVVSIRENIAVIGAPGYEQNKGCVYVFKDILNNKYSWSQTSILFANDGMKGDEFGFSINNLDGIIIIGSPNRDYLGTDMVGGAYIFAQSDDQYIQQKVVTFYMSSLSTRFGCSLASYDVITLVGGCFIDSKAGAMIVRDNIALTTLIASVVEPQSIMSLALSPITAGMGFPELEAGIIFLFYIGDLDIMLKLKRVFDGVRYTPPDAQYGDYFGSSLVFPTNETLYVSSPYHQQTGAIYVFTLVTQKDWDLVKKIFPVSSNSRFYGASMSTYGTNNFIGISISEKTKQGNVIAQVVYDLIPNYEYIPEKTIDQQKNGSFISSVYGIVTIIIGSTIVLLAFIFSFASRRAIHPKSIESTKSFSDLLKSQTLSNELHENFILDPTSCILDPGNPLGFGGFGVVRKGVYKDGVRIYPVAIKIMSEENLSKGNIKQKLFDEAALMVELRNPFIVQVYGMCGSMLVMELMSLGSLYNLIESNPQQLQRGKVRVQIMIDVVKGLEYLHEKSIIHGDMKSPNILLCEEGGSLKAKISDFGLSRIGYSNGMSMTATSGVLSLKWAAPELLQESPRLSQGIDIYAYGMIMWELLTLRKPYDGLSTGSVVRKVVCGEREIIPMDTPDILSNIIQDCWSEYSESRPRIGYIREELVRFQDSLIGKEYDIRTSTQPNLGSHSIDDSSQNELDLENGLQLRKYYNSICLDDTNTAPHPSSF